MKYLISLSERYDLKKPFISEWNTELIGDRLREEFAVYLESHKKEIGYKEGSSKRLVIPLVLQKFMNKKKISMVNDILTDSLISKFVLRKGEIKTVDERAAKTLEVYREKRRQKPDHTYTDYEGFICIMGEKEEIDTKEEDVEVIGGNVDYFGETPTAEVPEVIGKEVEYKEEVKEKVYKCEQCSREFKNAGALRLHKRSHKI